MAQRKQPFPSIIWGHGTTLSDIETLVRAGYFARSGLATIAFDAPGHGLVLEPGQLTLARGLLWSSCAVPWLDNEVHGRARDLDGDGRPDSGGLLWTSYIAHSRDNIRQTVLDAVQLGRVLRAFDGHAKSDQDFDGDGQPDLAGLSVAARADFDYAAAVKQGSRIRVASKYTQCAREHFADKGVHVDLIKLYGSMELAPLTGLADAIVDLVSTGGTLKANGLVEVEQIMPISARLIVNQAALKLKREPLRALIDAFERASAPAPQR